MKTKKIFLAGNRLLIDAENMRGLYDFDTANRRAKERGKRLMTNREQESLSGYENWWDSELMGRWFRVPARRPLKGILRVFNRFFMVNVFLPAGGYRDYVTGMPEYVGDYGYYWSSSPYNDYKGHSLFFGYNGVRLLNTLNRSGEISVRCVKDME